MSKTDWYVTLVPLLWGTMPIVAAEAFPPGHPLLIATIRSLGAGLGILLVLRQLPPPAWHWRILMLGTVNITLTFGLFFVASGRLGGGLITLLMALSPFWATLFGRALLGHPIRPVRILLILSGVGGIVLLIGAAPFHADPVGLLAGVGASVCMGCGIVLFRKWGRPASLLVFTGWQLVAGGAMLLGVLACGMEDIPETITFKNVTALLYLVAASTVLAYALWFRGIERLGAQQTSMLLLLVPIVGLSIDALLLGKRLVVIQYLGGFIVIASLFLDAMAARTSPQRLTDRHKAHTDIFTGESK